MNYCKNAVYYNTILNLSIKERKKKNYTHINNNNNKKKKPYKQFKCKTKRTHGSPCSFV